jgi:membrane protein DedA with SNARE-associated domain
MAAEPGQELTGLSGVAADVLAALGEVGVGALTFAETIFPPIPSEIVLPLAGYLSERGRLDLLGVVVAATVGSLLGALALYGAGSRLGEDRSVRLLARLPLVDADDVRVAGGWFHRHGRGAVLFGRLVPGVRSLISLPAGAARMPLLLFTALTTAGSLLWNTLLVGAGYLLGTQYELVDKYSSVIDVALAAGLVAVIAAGVVRRVRRRRAADDQQGAQ